MSRILYVTEPVYICVCRLLPPPQELLVNIYQNITSLAPQNLDTIVGKGRESLGWLMLTFHSWWNGNLTYILSSVTVITPLKLWICLRFLTVSHLKEPSWVRVLCLHLQWCVPHGEWGGFQPTCDNIDGPFLLLTHKRSRWGSMSPEVDINPETTLYNLWPFSGCCLKIIGWAAGH